MGWFKSRTEELREMCDLADDLTARDGVARNVEWNGEIVYTSTKPKPVYVAPIDTRTPEEIKKQKQQVADLLYRYAKSRKKSKENKKENK